MARLEGLDDGGVFAEVPQLPQLSQAPHPELLASDAASASARWRSTNPARWLPAASFDAAERRQPAGIQRHTA